MPTLHLLFSHELTAGQQADARQNWGVTQFVRLPSDCSTCGAMCRLIWIAWKITCSPFLSGLSNITQTALAEAYLAALTKQTDPRYRRDQLSHIQKTLVGQPLPVR
ncbi:MAG: hypothetical protein HC880_11990, partial [Bacteroidia bacterium]|nr:hypothetical protein [Bacteroidia bacterium]